jgi:hypothetical protein
MAAGAYRVIERLKTGICSKAGDSGLPGARWAAVMVPVGSRAERCAGEVRWAEGRQGPTTHPLEWVAPEAFRLEQGAVRAAARMPGGRIDNLRLCAQNSANCESSKEAGKCFPGCCPKQIPKPGESEVRHSGAGDCVAKAIFFVFPPFCKGGQGGF